MLARAVGYASPLALLLGCPGPWPPFVTCEDLDACSTGASTSTTTDAAPPTTSGVQTVTGDASGPATDGPGVSTGTGLSAELPQVVERTLEPDYLDHPDRIAVTVVAAHADGVHMRLDDGAEVELAADGPDRFTGEILALTGLDNGPHTARFTPRQGELAGAEVAAPYVLALPDPGDAQLWERGDDGLVAAIAVLPDGHPVELGTYHVMGTSRCYLRLREADGDPLDAVDLLAPAHCRAIDLAVDRDTGALHVLLERELQDDLVWWAGQLLGWGAPPTKLAQGEPADTALALAARPDLVAVCGARSGAPDELDALAVLLRPGHPPDRRTIPFKSPVDLPNAKTFKATARDCAFADDGTLALVGEARGNHADDAVPRDRLFLLELDPASAADPSWTVAGPVAGVQSRALALAVGDDGHYYLAGTSCLDDCAPEAWLRVHAPGGALADHIPLGPLGAALLGPHDVAWSPAGYAVVALGGLQGPFTQFKVQALALDEPEPLWTFVAAGPGFELALAVAVGDLGEVYAGGLGPSFAALGG